MNRLTQFFCGFVVWMMVIPFIASDFAHADALQSAGVGSLSGALIGSMSGPDKNRQENALIGSAIGAALGYAMGNEIEKTTPTRIGSSRRQVVEEEYYSSPPVVVYRSLDQSDAHSYGRGRSSSGWNDDQSLYQRPIQRVFHSEPQVIIIERVRDRHHRGGHQRWREQHHHDRWGYRGH